jgi:hypothetical protein
MPATVQEAFSLRGEPLEAGARDFMESRFGYDFSKVRVHTDESAAASAREIGARAYTVGRDVIFGEGRYAPSTNEGKRLLAHELAHVVQQGRGGAAPSVALGATHETDAARAAAAAVGGGAPVQVSAATGLGLACDNDPELERALEGLEEQEGPSEAMPKEPAAQDALTPDELIDEHVFGPRVHEEVGDLRRRLANREARLRANPTDKALQAEVGEMRARLGTIEGSGLDPGGRGANVPGIGNINTRAAIQVIGPDGKIIALERGSWGPSHHAEGDALAKLRIRLGTRKLPAGTRIMVGGNQVVCGEVCKPDIARFAKDYGVPLGNVSASVRARPKIVGQGQASGKTTERTGLRGDVPKATVKTEPLFPGGKEPPQEPKKSETTAKTQTSGDEPDKPASSEAPAKPTEPAKTSKPSAAAKTSKTTTPSTTSDKPAGTPAKTSTTATRSKTSDKPAGTPAKAPPTSTPKSPTKGGTKATDVPAGKPKAKPDAPPSTPAADPTMQGSAKALSPAANAAVKTFSGLVNQYAGKATEIATRDPQIAATYSDLMHLMDAKALVDDPKGFAAQKLANYFLDSAFSKLKSQLAEQEAAFWNKYPDLRHFHQIDVGSGQTLDSLNAAYADEIKGLQTPKARHDLTTAFVMLGLPENAPQSEIDKRIKVINAMLANQPDIGPYVQRYNEAQRAYLIALGTVWTGISLTMATLEQLPTDYFDQIRRRGDLLINTAKILDELAKKVAWLSALPGGDAACFLVNKVAEGVRDLGEGLQDFESSAGQRKGEYQRELDRLSKEIGHINNLHGAFDVIYRRSSP